MAERKKAPKAPTPSLGLLAFELLPGGVVRCVAAWEPAVGGNPALCKQFHWLARQVARGNLGELMASAALDFGEHRGDIGLAEAVAGEFEEVSSREPVIDPTKVFAHENPHRAPFSVP
jgi:hypothetical protein